MTISSRGGVTGSRRRDRRVDDEPSPRTGSVAVTCVAACALVLGLVSACGEGDEGSSGSAIADDPAGTTAETRDADAAPSNIDPALLPEGVTVAMVEEGRELFAGGGICHTCHMEDATGGPLAPTSRTTPG